MAAIVAAPLCAKAPATWTTFALGVAALLAGVCVTVSSRAMISARGNIVALGFAAGAVLCLLQILPLPSSFIASASPRAAEIYDVVSRSTPLHHAISLDRSATAHGLEKFLVLALFAWISPRLFTTAARRVRVAQAIAASGVAVFAIGVVEALVHGQSVIAAPLTSTFANANHTGAFLGFASLVALGLSLSMDGAARAAALVAAVLCGVGVFLTLSRGAMITYAGACIAWTVVTLRSPTRGAASRLGLSLGIGSVAALVISLTLQSVVAELGTLFDATRFEKPQLWANTLPLLRDFMWTGCGRGAFGSVFTMYDTTRTHLTFTHVENEPLQSIVDFGVLGLVLIAAWLVAVVAAWRAALQRSDALGSAIAVTFVSVLNVADFNLELLSMAVPLAVTLSLAQSRLRARREVATRTKRTSRIMGGILAGTAVVAVLVAPLARHSLANDTLQARTAAMACDDTDGRIFIGRHPADFVIPALTAERQLACARLPPSVFSLLNSAQFLAPREPAPHRLTARALIRTGRAAQAIAEYATAIELDALLTHDVLLELTLVTKTVDTVIAVAERVPTQRLEIARFALWRQAPAVALNVLGADELNEHADLTALRARAELDLLQLKPALAHGARLEATSPQMPDGYAIQAVALELLGDAKNATAALERGLHKTDDRTPLTTAMFALLERQGRFAEARSFATALLKAAPTTSDASRAHSWIGNTFVREGSHLAALQEFERARDLSPTVPQYWQLVARQRKRMGDDQGALAELRRARSELGPSPLFEPASLDGP